MHIKLDISTELHTMKGQNDEISCSVRETKELSRLIYTHKNAEWANCNTP